MADTSGGTGKGSVGVMICDRSIRLSIVLASLQLIWFLATATVTSAQDSGSALARAQAVNDQCLLEVQQDKRLDVLRGKVALFGEDSTPAMLSLERKPTGPEVSALKLLYGIHIRCIMRLNQALKPEVPLENPLQLNRYALGTISALSLLINGHVTYAQYSRFRDQQGEELLKEAQDEFNRQRATQQADEQARSAITLACVGESPSEFRGVEFQYRIDLRNNFVSASRGPAPPADVRISDTEISFNQEKSRVTISRLSGLFSINAGGTGAIISGRCTKATSQTF